MAVADIRLDGEIDRSGIEVLGTRGTADPLRMHLTGVRGDFIGGIHGSLRIPSADLLCERSDVLGVSFRPASGLGLPAALAYLGIIETLLFGACERLFRYQDALPFIPLSGAAEAQNDSAQRR